MNHDIRDEVGNWLDSVEPDSQPQVRRFTLRSGRNATDPATAATQAQAKQARIRILAGRRDARRTARQALAEVAL